VSRRLRIWTIGLAALACIAAAWGFILHENALGYSRVLANAAERSKTRAVVFREFVDSAFSSIDLALRQLDTRPDIPGVVLPSDPRLVRDILRRTARIVPIFFGLAVTDASGQIVVSIRDDPSTFGNVADRTYFAYHRTNPTAALRVSPPINVRFVDQWAIPVTMRVEDPAGHFAGVLLGSVKPEYFNDFMQSLGIDDAAIVLPTGAVLARLPHDADKAQTGAPNGGAPIAAGTELMRRWRQESADTYTGPSPFGSAIQVASYSTLKSTPGAVYVGLDLAKELAPWRAESRDRFVAGILFTILAALLALALTLGMRRDERIAAELREARDAAHAARDAAEEARVRAEQADFNKSNFLAHTSHELRTPLNAIIGFSEILLNEALGPLGEPRYKEYSSYIHNSGHHLLGVVNNILDLAQVSSGRWLLRPDRFGVAEIVDEICKQEAPLAASRHVTLKRELPESLPDFVTERRVIRQILFNLVSNAVKFTMGGGTVTVAVVPAADGGLVLRVSDTGIGIDPAITHQVLQPFQNVSNLLAHKPGGTGLGLPLCRVFAELLGGEIAIASRLDQGTVISVRLPAGCFVPAKDEASAPADQPRAQTAAVWPQI
jgi:signal transduction histidine kinase